MASSSSGALNDAFSGLAIYQREDIGSSQSPKLWDVFINHRGPDVKETLALQLYKSLENLGIRAFLDREEMELGDVFPSTIQSAICFALVQIAIFSKGYADSAWCLTELDLMLESNKTIIPIFYDVAPSDLRRLETGAYANSFKKYKEKGRYLDKLDKWEETLHKVSFRTGYELVPQDCDLEKLCIKVASVVQRELRKTTPMEIAKYPVGISEILQDFEKTCWQETGRTRKIIGIYGLGGSGKTTLATAFFDRIRSKFTESSFLSEVRETSNKGKLTSLQRKLLRDLVHEDRKFYSIRDGLGYLRSRLGRGPFLSFLICIDDVDHPKQLDDLVGWDTGDNTTSSLIIVTSRDERVLIQAGVSARYKLKEMNDSQSTELFCWHAFHKNTPSSGYENLVKSFVRECGGLPLSLQVLGGLVSGSADKTYWETQLDKVRRTLPRDIEQKLMISVDSLEDEQKQIFMDIACFFVHRSSHMATRIWEGTGWSAEHTLQTLIDKCLVEVYIGSNFWSGFDSGSIPLLKMHDHIRDLGRKLAGKNNSPCRLWRPKHLLFQQEMGFQSILAENADHSFRCLNSIFEFRYFLGNSIDCNEKTSSLFWLELDLSLMGALDESENHEEKHLNSLPSIPVWIPLQSLQYLKICNGRLGRLWERQVPFYLKELVLDGMILEEFPDSLGMLSYLEDLVVRGRAEWNGREWDYPTQIDGRSFSNSLTELTNLKTLVLRDLALSGELTLNNSRESSPTVSLQSIDIRDVKLASKVIISAEYLHSLKSIHLESMENLIELSLGLEATPNHPDWATDTESDTGEYSEAEELSSCESQICLERVIIDGCWALQKIAGIENLEGLKCLQISARNASVRGCIDTWQRLLPHVASVIWNPAVETWLSVSMLDFERCIGEDDTVTEIRHPQQQKIVLPVTGQPTAIIIFMLIRSSGENSQKVLKMPLLDWRVSCISEGLNAVAVVVTDEERINKMLYGVSDWIPTVTAGKVENGFLITVNKIQTLEMLWSFLKAERITELRKARPLDIAEWRPLDVAHKTPLEIAKHTVGISRILHDFEKTCWKEAGKTRKIIGIYGIGGSGKTTLATSFFKRIRSKYSESSFLFDVREASNNGKLTSLQSKLLRDLVNEDRTFYSISEGSSYLGSRLGRGPLPSFLICIDDVDHPEQLNALVGWDIGDNATSSLIIVICRDERVLIEAGVGARYKMKEMNESQGIELFCWNAFHKKYPSSGYEDLVKSFVKECGGLPLSLQVLGGLVSGSAEKRYWEIQLDKVRRTLPEDIEQKLMISAESLDDEQKQIFMDVACFFVHRSSDMATRIWKGTGWKAEQSLQTLIDKCLVEVYIGSDHCMGSDSRTVLLLRMHDHIRDFGRKIADKMSSPRRLWDAEYLRSQQEKGFQSILAESADHSLRCLNSSFEFRYFLGNSVDSDNESTSLLWLELDFSWMGRLVESENHKDNMNNLPSRCTIPPWIPLQNLQCLQISNGRLGRLFEGQVPFHLKELVLDGTILEDFPDSLGMLTCLEVMVVRGKAGWNIPMQIDGRAFSDSLTELTNLKTLVLRDLALCGELTLNTTRESRQTVNLQTLDIRDVKLASKVIISAEYLHSLKSLHLECMENLIEVVLELDTTPNYIDSAIFAELDPREYSEAGKLSSSGCKNCLERIIIDGCWALQKITGIEELEGLKCLQISARNADLRRCMKTWQELRPHVASVIWNPVVEAWLYVTRSDLEEDNDEAGTVTELLLPRHKIVLPVTAKPSAIVIFMLIRSLEKDSQKVLKMPLLDWRVSCIAEGLNAVAVVVTDEARIKQMLYRVSDWIPTVTAGKVENGFLITVNKIQDLGDVLSFLRKKKIEEKIEKLQKARSKHLGLYPVGISEIVNDFNRTYWEETGRTRKIIGIYGPEGSGKSTLAKAFFHGIRPEYSESSFLFNVREISNNGHLTILQSKLLKDLVHEDRTFHSIPEGLDCLGSRICRGPLRNFLICIDDVDHPEQLNGLAGWHIGDNATSSLIIVTSRDEKVLIQAEVSARYKMKELNDSLSTKLFCLHAFRQPYPFSGYEDLVKSFVKVCGGSPLSLQVFGRQVFGSADKMYWEMLLGKARKRLTRAA